jgi:hypothetical protein
LFAPDDQGNILGFKRNESTTKGRGKRNRSPFKDLSLAGVEKFCFEELKAMNCVPPIVSHPLHYQMNTGDDFFLRGRDLMIELKKCENSIASEIRGIDETLRSFNSALEEGCQRCDDQMQDIAHEGVYKAFSKAGYHFDAQASKPLDRLEKAREHAIEYKKEFFNKAEPEKYIRVEHKLR